MSSADREVQEIQDSLEDTGVTCLLPVPYSLSSLEAEPERADLMKRLKSSDLMQEDSRLPGEEEVCQSRQSHLISFPEPGGRARGVIPAATGAAEGGCGLQERATQDTTGNCGAICPPRSGCSSLLLATPSSSLHL